ncbi:hypothetical protein PLEOSDRAFT_1100901 [Pleurotus ostreatus PC15]|uniref:Retrotransposon gag domain-containing protein n=1 Tax=Pleurotus ostreatus (strain PC15) TaxID=1137138 RepID=A0A067P955_PLEO1|nr:hypothetical protein PLEOSDRAFT_1100901 [Pleurotus ostreatus PC15]
MRKSVNFLEDAQVEPSKQIRMVARYTEGKAHTYYLNVIVDHEEEWSLEAYFRDIFDACFPSNFRESQRRRLYRFRQDTLTVKEYIAELTEIVDLVGDISPREQVVKLFKGLLFGVVVYLPRFRAGKISLTKPYGKNPYRRLYVQARVHIVRRIIAAELESRHLGGKRIMHDGGREIFVAKETSKWLVSSSGGKTCGAYSRDSKPSAGGVPKEAGQLSREERARLRTENKCFICKQLGHISCACPRGNIVKSKGSGPPGVSANSVRIDFERHARLEAAARDVQPLESLSASPSMGIAETLPEEMEQRTNAEARTPWLNGEMDNLRLDVWRRWLAWTYSDDCIGFAHANLQTWVLEVNRDIGYPGDHLHTEFGCDNKRFRITHNEGRTYRITDFMHNFHDVEVDEEWLEDSTFNLVRWYGDELRVRLDLPYDDLAWNCWELEVTDAVAMNAWAYLEHSYLGTFSPNTGDDYRFSVERVPDSNQCRIIDRLLDRVEYINASALCFGWFNLCEWYDNCVRRHDYDRRRPSIDNTDSADSEPGGDDSSSDDEDGNIGGAVRPRGREESIEHLEDPDSESEVEITGDCFALELFGQQVDRNKYAAIHRNAIVAKDSSRSIPKPVVITVEINGSKAVALLDSGSLGDFMSCDLADQLVARRKIELATPLL